MLSFIVFICVNLGCPVFQSYPVAVKLLNFPTGINKSQFYLIYIQTPYHVFHIICIQFSIYSTSMRSALEGVNEIGHHLLEWNTCRVPLMSSTWNTMKRTERGRLYCKAILQLMDILLEVVALLLASIHLWGHSLGVFLGCQISPFITVTKNNADHCQHLIDKEGIW